jgi:hypothetical protein
VLPYFYLSHNTKTTYTHATIKIINQYRREYEHQYSRKRDRTAWSISLESWVYESPLSMLLLSLMLSSDCRIIDLKSPKCDVSTENEPWHAKLNTPSSDKICRVRKTRLAINPLFRLKDQTCTLSCFYLFFLSMLIWIWCYTCFWGLSIHRLVVFFV